MTTDDYKNALITHLLFRGQRVSGIIKTYDVDNRWGLHSHSITLYLWPIRYVVSWGSHRPFSLDVKRLPSAVSEEQE